MFCRGGYFSFIPLCLRSANRFSNTPGNRNNNIGFRISITALSQAFTLKMPDSTGFNVLDV